MAIFSEMMDELCEKDSKIALLREALKPFAIYYDINDCEGRPADDTLEVPIGDLRIARRIYGDPSQKPSLDGAGK